MRQFTALMGQMGPGSQNVTQCQPSEAFAHGGILQGVGILYYFRDIVSYLPKVASFHTQRVFCTPVGVDTAIAYSALA